MSFVVDRKSKSSDKDLRTRSKSPSGSNDPQFNSFKRLMNANSFTRADSLPDNNNLSVHNISKSLSNDIRMDSVQDTNLKQILKSSHYKISTLFDNHFSLTKDDINRILLLTTNAKVQDMSSINQELRRLWLQLFNEIDALKEHCELIEKRYKDATTNASRELQQSMNILFTMQQKTAQLEESAAISNKLKEDLK
jgi:hypothetical protein